MIETVERNERMNTRMMFARAIAGRVLDRIHKICGIMKGVKRWKLTVNVA